VRLPGEGFNQWRFVGAVEGADGFAQCIGFGHGEASG
jgi:hypothetical protein